jgi:hypothetical protein
VDRMTGGVVGVGLWRVVTQYSIFGEDCFLIAWLLTVEPGSCAGDSYVGGTYAGRWLVSLIFFVLGR